MLPGSEELFSPRWSPDGRYIAAIAVGSQDRLLLFDFTTKRWTELSQEWRVGRGGHRTGGTSTLPAFAKIMLCFECGLATGRSSGWQVSRISG